MRHVSELTTGRWPGLLAHFGIDADMGLARPAAEKTASVLMTRTGAAPSSVRTVGRGMDFPCLAWSRAGRSVTRHGRLRQSSVRFRPYRAPRLPEVIRLRFAAGYGANPCG